MYYLIVLMSFLCKGGAHYEIQKIKYYSNLLHGRTPSGTFFVELD